MAHAGLAHLAAEPGGPAWLERLPGLVEECAEVWSLSLGDPFGYACASLVLPATTDDGTEVVLKVAFPHREGECEAEALRLWNGDGAVLLLEYDEERNALLLERLRPGSPLKELDQDAALDVVVGLLPRLWKPAARPFRALGEEAAWWASYLPDHWERAGRPFERELLDAALDALDSLPGSQREHVLLHQDLHADNVLSAEREPWLAIDPKPLAGEREFGIAGLVRGDELGHSEEKVRHRLDRLSSELDLDRDRARRWALAQTLAWGIEGADRVGTQKVEAARWLLQAE